MEYQGIDGSPVSPVTLRHRESSCLLRNGSRGMSYGRIPSPPVLLEQDLSTESVQTANQDKPTDIHDSERDDGSPTENRSSDMVQQSRPLTGNSSHASTVKGCDNAADTAIMTHKCSSSSANTDIWSSLTIASRVNRHSDEPEPYQRHSPSEIFTDDIIKSACSTFPIIFFCFAVYSVAMSAAALILAHERTSFHIGALGLISYANATSLCAGLAKSVELTLVTIIIAILGQILSRRAIGRGCRQTGISVAEMTMRTWIMQPGTMITHPSSVRYAGRTFLGFVALLTTITATFYTTAAEALVYPKLRMGQPVTRQLSGRVETSFGNAAYLKQSCQTPIVEDSEDHGVACLHIGYAGQSFHNFQAYLGQWGALSINNANGDLTVPASRPEPRATFDGDDGAGSISVKGQWILSSREDVANASSKAGRFVQRVTMATPHANVVYAARDPVNRLLQPGDLSGKGEYNVTASVPAPMVQVVCAGLSESEVGVFVTSDSESEVTGTTLDDVFSFGTNALQQPIPHFVKSPKPYNTLVSNITYAGASAYLLTATAPETTGQDFVLCSIQARQYQFCTTQYYAAEAGAHLSVHCDDDPGNILPYLPYSGSDVEMGAPEADFADVAGEWLRAIALNNGAEDGNAQIARLLAQMVPSYDDNQVMHLPNDRPSIGEALAILAARPLMMSSIHAPFVTFFNYTAPKNIMAGDSVRQSFRALVTTQTYNSGPLQPWQNVFYVILWSAFSLSVCAAGYLIWIYYIKQRGDIVDLTEPQNAFLMAINSPQLNTLRRNGETGPIEAQWMDSWVVERDDSSYVGMGDGQDDKAASVTRYVWLEGNHRHDWVATAS